MKTLVRHTLIAAALLALAAGCTLDETTTPEPAAGSELRSDKERVTAEIPDADLAALCSDNGAFALDLYQALKTQEGNLFYSPHSISVALAMTYGGARGETAAEMAETLHFDLPQEQLHPAFNRLDRALAGRGEGEEQFRLHIVNALWGQEGYTFLEDYLDLLAQHYEAGMRVLDFAADPEAARQRINEWVSEQTEDRIQDLLPQGVIDGLTRLVLTNAIYFNAAWAKPFEERLTQEGTFYLLDNSSTSVPMMSQTTGLAYLDGEGYQVVELPYQGNEFSMVILVPEQGTFAQFEETLTAQTLASILQNMDYGEVNLTMPKFKFESAFSLGGTLSEMGMPLAFSMQADFSGMDGTDRLYIRDVVHKAFVSVDEAGTEAAAATAVVMAEKGMPAKPFEIKIDRPFLFMIRDIQTGTILFLGRVVQPG